MTVAASATLNLNNRGDTINGLNGEGTVKLTAGTQSLTLGDGDANGSFSGALQNTGATLNLVKIGSGTQTMAVGSTLSYGGSTIINGGTLVVNGTKSGAGQVTVNSGGTLAGAGTVNGFVAINGGAALAPGGSIGTLATNDLLFVATTSKLSLDIDFDGSMAADLINLTGTISPSGGTLALTFTNAPPVATPLKFLVVNNNLSDAITTTFATITTSGLAAQYGVAVVYNFDETDSLGRTGDGNDLAILITVVPEASAWMLGAAVSAASGMAWRFRRKA